MAILTLVCKIHVHDRWPENISEFLISPLRNATWQNLETKYLLEKNLTGGPVKNTSCFDDDGITSCSDKILTAVEN